MHDLGYWSVQDLGSKRVTEKGERGRSTRSVRLIYRGEPIAGRSLLLGGLGLPYHPQLVARCCSSNLPDRNRRGQRTKLGHLRVDKFATQNVGDKLSPAR